MTKVTEEEYWAACNDLVGFCTVCCDFTRDDTESDAEGYDCPVCKGNTVVGAEQALIMDLIEFEE